MKGTETRCRQGANIFYLAPWQLKRGSRFCSRLCANTAKRGVKLQEETKKKISQALLGPRNPFFGRKHSRTSKKKMSEKLRGRVAWNRGLPWSDEAKKKMSIAHSTPFHAKIGIANLPKIRIYTPERLERMRKAMTGRKHSDQSIQLMKKYKFNEAFFDVITPESAYWIGFLMADGSISQIKTHANGGITPYVTLKLQLADLEHLKKYRKSIDSTHPISVYKDKEGHRSCRLGFSAKKLAATLAQYGVLPRKSISATIRGGLEYNKDVWRGIIDGDGSLGNNGKRRLTLYGSYSLVLQFKEFVEKIMGVPIHSSPQQRRSIYSITLCGSLAVNVVRILYEGCSLALARKLEKAKLIMATIDDLKCN